MSARRNGSSSRRTAAEAAAAPSPMKTKMKSNAKAKSDVPGQLDALQEQLTRQLQQTVEDTVGAVCDDFQHELKAAFISAAANNSSSSSTRSSAKQQQITIPAVAQFGAASTADYEVYYSCCKRLVAYISANMATSPDFAPQMDRIILACHSNAPERVLRSIATKNVWFHRRDGGVAAAETASETDDVEVIERPTRAAAAAAKSAYGGSPAPKKSERLIKKEKESPARMTRTTARKSAEASLLPPRALSKRRSPAAPASEPPVAKRLRPAARRSLPLPNYDDEDENKDEDEEEEEEEEEEEVGVEVDQEEYDDDEEFATNQPHYETADELLDFKDPVRDMCYVDKRTPAQTKFFKERLRKAILFVDAQLCKPPPGKVCARDCKKIRAVMCDRNLPCRNKICRVWHDVEVHIDRCQNTHCELKNRIMLRETMHKIDHKKLQIHNAKLEVQAKKKQLDDIKNEESNEREQYIELTLLTNEIGELEGDIAAAEEELGILNGTKKAFWACLNVVGIELKDDVADGFPDLAMHYANKKQTAAKTRAPKRAAKDQENFVTEEEPQQDVEVEMSDDGKFGGTNNTGSPMPPITRRTRRTRRRSTTKSFQAMAQDVVSAESEEETKSAEDGEQGNGVGGNAAVQEEMVGEPVGSDDGIAVNNIQVTGQSTTIKFQNAQANGGDATEDQFPESQDLNDLSELLPQVGTDPDPSVQSQQVSQIVITNQRAVRVATSNSSNSSTSTSSTIIVNRSSATMVASASGELQSLSIPSNIQIASQPQPATSLPLTVLTPANQQPLIPAPLTGAPANSSA